MYILIVETQFHRCLRQIEVVEYKCENGYGYGYPDGYPDILYPILLHHWFYIIDYNVDPPHRSFTNITPWPAHQTL